MVTLNTTANLTQITAPRVPLIDKRTGLVSREWYRFFLSLYDLTGGGQNNTTLTDLQVGPPLAQQEDLTGLVVNIEALQTLPSQQSALEQIAELQKQIDALNITPLPNVGDFLTSSTYLAQAFTSQTSIPVTHNFGKYPVVNVIDSAGVVVVPLSITHASLNAFTVAFSVATTGDIVAVVGF